MPSFLEMLQAALDPAHTPGLYIAPEIPAKKIKGAAHYASWGQETPLVLIDNSTFGSGKAGALVTSHALYVDTKKQRFDLTAVRQAPTFDSLDGFLPTPGGTVKIPKMLVREAQEAWERVFQIIVSINAGVPTSSAAAGLEGPLGALVTQTLKNPKIALGAQIPGRKLGHAALVFPDWCDWLSRERVIAYVDETVFGKGDEGLVLTDRRLLGSLHGQGWTIPYASITAVSTAKATLARELHVRCGMRTETITLSQALEAVDPLAAFLDGVSRLPPDQRQSPTPPYASAEDPTGITGLLSRLPGADPRPLIALQLLKARVAAGQVPAEAAAQLVERIGLLAHTIAHGRGAHEGWRLSPLHGNDLLDALANVFDPPVHQSRDEQTVVTDFSMVRKGSLGKAAVSNAIGLAAFAIVGVGWVAGRGTTVASFRLATRHLGGATGFAPLGQRSTEWVPLQAIDAALAGQLLDVIESSEAIGLLVRVLWGGDRPASTLLGQPAEVIQREAATLLGPVDLSAFFSSQR